MVNRIKILGLSAIFVAASLLLQSCEVQESDLVAGDFQLDKPVAYTKRPVAAMAQTDPRTNAVLTPGGDLFIHQLKDGPNSDADINITGSCTAAVEGVKGAGDVMSISSSYDGQRILFSMHLGVLEDGNADPNTWDVWEYLLNPEPGENALRMVISGKTCGDAGLVSLIAREGNDLDPAYLPDGRIVFTSDRQVGGRNLQLLYGLSNEPSEDERRREPALNLHTMNSVGKQIRQISYNQSDDRFPSVLNTGEIVFSRWEVTGSTESRFDIYTVHPDGSEMKLLYGSHSHFSTAFDPAFYKPRQMSDGRLVSMLMPYSDFDPNDPVFLDTTSGGGEIVFIDYENFADVNVPRVGKTSSQSAGHVSATNGRANTRLGMPTFGRYSNPFPLWEAGGSKRLLISLAFCEVTLLVGEVESTLFCRNNEALPLAPSEYGLFYLDTEKQTTSIVLLPEVGMALTDAVVLIDRTALLGTSVNALPTVLTDKSVNGMSLDQDLIDRNMGAIKIRSVYDTMRLNDIGLISGRFITPESLPCLDVGNGNQAVTCDGANSNHVVDLATLADPLQTTADQRPVRYVRVVGAMPSFDGTQGFAFGIRGNEMRAILGYATVEPDGSVYVEVPADKPFALELVSKDGHKFLGRLPSRSSATGERTIRAHDHWLQVIPGETLECNGCHEGHNGAAPLNTGAPSSEPFPNTLASMSPNPFETMAETRDRVSCAAGNCDARLLNRDMVYSDVWTDPAVLAPFADFAIEYNDRSGVPPRQGLTDNVPIFRVSTSGCLINDLTNPTDQGNWGSEDGKCRIVIDYERHIQSLWDKQRMVDDGLGLGGSIDRRCTICHSTADEMGVPQLPAGQGQLDLTSNGPRHTQNNNANRVTSYEELVRQGFELELDANGAVQRVVDISFIDDPNFVDDPNNPNDMPARIEVRTDRVLPTGPVINPFFARHGYFNEVMMAKELRNGRALPVATVDHSVMMTRGELRVVTEWIEMGVQYYNNPGEVP